MSRGAAEQTGSAGDSAGKPVVRELRDTAEILHYLEQDRPYAAGALSYLDPANFPDSRWLALDGEDPGLCLLGSGPRGSLVLTMGSPEAVAILLDAAVGPLQTYLVCKREHLPAVDERYIQWDRHDLQRMVVTRDVFRPVEMPGVERLLPSQVEALNRLYRTESGATFAPYHLSQGVYYGMWQDGMLVSVAGTQFISWTYKIGIIANVLTHPKYRARGYATAVTGAVTAALLEHCTEVVLNVDPANVPAVRAYTRLGYRHAGRVSEAWALRKRLGFWSAVERWFRRVFES